MTRRPWPALVSLLALLLLTALVWWRVLHRGSSSDAAGAPCPTPSSTASVLPAPASVTISVLNSTSRHGLAATVRRLLVNDGFDVPGLPANDRPALHNKITVSAEIRYGPQSAAGARLVRYFFPGAKLVPTSTKTSTVVVSLGTGYKRMNSKTVVDRYLRQHNIQYAGTTPQPQPSGSATC